MRDSYPPGAIPNDPPADTSFPVPSSQPAFPTHAAVREKHAIVNAAMVNAIVERLRAEVTREGGHAATVSIDVPARARDAVRAIIEPSGWALEFGSDQRDGSWVTVRPR